MKIYGRNSVAEAVKSGKTIDRLVVEKDLKDAGANRIIADAKSRGIKIFFREKEYLDREVTGKHQGFIAEITDFGYCELDDILAYAKEKGSRRLSYCSTVWKTLTTSARCSEFASVRAFTAW